MKSAATLQEPAASQNQARLWHVITPEYPPQPGGVSDYTHGLAEALAAAGDEVCVWCPAAGLGTQSDKGVLVHDVLGKLHPRDIHRLSNALNQFPAPRRLLLQWVPHGFGYRSMNLPFCLWLWSRSALHRDRIEIMVHEPFLAFGEGTWKQDLAAAVHRAMTVVLLRAAQSVWVSTPKWIVALKPYALGRKLSFHWLPIPSNIPFVKNPASQAAIRARFEPGCTIAGHFGTYGRVITDLLREMIPALLNRLPNAGMILIGPGSDRFRSELVQASPSLEARLFATGYLNQSEVSAHIRACDVMIQPYPDGVTTRRSSVMAALSHGRPTVTTSGKLSEPFWAECRAVALHSVGDLEGFLSVTLPLYQNGEKRKLLGLRAEELYAERFDIRNVVASLRRSSEA